MALSLLHATLATGTDAGNGDIHKAEWNQEHAIVMATNKLLGRSTTGTGSVEEIAIGSGLSLSAGTLSASGGGGGALTISNKTAAYTVVAGDLGTIINCTSGTFTVSLTSAATLGSGFTCYIYNTGSGVITIDPSGTQTIDGVSTLTLYQNEGMQIVCNGTNWFSGSQKHDLMVSSNGTSAPASAGAAESVAIGYGASTSNSGFASFSIAIGKSALTEGSNSLALGASASVTGTTSYATAIGANSGGNGSVAAGGGFRQGSIALNGSRTSGADSFAAAVANNTSSYGVTSDSAIAIGYQAKASGIYSMAFGYSAQATATGSFCVVLDNNGSTASGRGSAVIGDQCTASSDNSFAFGRGSLASVNGKYAYGSGRTAAFGDAQHGRYVLRSNSTSATSVILRTDGFAAAATNQVILPNNAAYAFTGTVVARQSAAGGTASAAWKVEGLIRREGSAGTTTLVASTVTAISNVPGWTLALTADTTNGGLAITATGAAATNIRWVANIEATETIYD